MMAKPESQLRPRQARELARRLGLLTEAQAAAGWGVIVVLAALLGAIYLNQASKIAAIGRRVQIEQLELDEVKRVNAELERQIAESQGLERLDAEARRLGFVPATPADIDYVVIPNFPTEEVTAEDLITEEMTGAAAAAPPVTSPVPETLWEAITLAFRDLGIDLTRGEAHEP
jgi:hypothetical protein